MVKKKKIAINPARGFATTSVASKSKPERVEKDQPKADTVEKSEKSPHSHSDLRKNTDLQVDSENKPLDNHVEDLTVQLERDELQLMVESYGTKVRKDVQRQISRVDTDRRVLRNQSQPLNSSHWLFEGLLHEILELARKDGLEDIQYPRSDTRVDGLHEDEVVVRCWKLMRSLTAMNIPRDIILQILTYNLRTNPAINNAEHIWGFQEALDFLALNGEETDLPLYVRRTIKLHVSTNVSSDADSRPVSRGSPPPPVNREWGSKEDSAVMTPEPSRTSFESAPSDAADEDNESLQISDLDSDIEPDQLVSKYIQTKARLYQIHPEFVIQTNRSKSSKLPPPLSDRRSAGIKKLLDKMRRIEADVLFDHKAAEMLWTTKRNEMAQQLALERRLHKLAQNVSDHRTENGNPDSTDHGPQHSSNSSAEDALSESDSHFDNGDMLGGMFTPEEEKIDGGALGDQTDSQRIVLRDFGKIVGLHPRRVLEDVCRARDSGVKFAYRVVSPTVYSCRHSVAISWAKAQYKLPATGPPSISLEEQLSPKNKELVNSMTFTMTGVSTPDVQQSQAYVATAALFWLSSTTPSENKAFLRLPSSWRDLWLEFEEHQKTQSDAADRAELQLIRKLIQTQAKQDDDDGIVLSSAFKGRSREDTPSHSRPPVDRSILPTRPELLADLWITKQAHPAYQRMLPQRMSLPMFGFKNAALSAIGQHQVLILCGETGCGKSTQLPAYILENELSQGRDCKIYCTQPRRISAISLAQRVSEELGEHKKDLGSSRSLVGYAIRLETRVSPQTKLVYATVGIVLRMLESSNGLSDVTHLIIDEVHERSIDTDFLLIVLRSLMARRPELKVILMSATVDATRFSRYLNDAPIVTVPGRTFPVQTLFLEDAIEMMNYRGGGRRGSEVEFDADENTKIESNIKNLKQLQSYSPHTRDLLAEYDEYRIDYELIIKLIDQIFADPKLSPYGKAVLVFLPGIAEIRELHLMLSDHLEINRTAVIYPLHSSIATEEQQAAFLVPPPGVRKIVLATNIAETGITIPDITCVIDTGKHKEMRYDERRQLSRLVQSFISRANAKQRRGRAGRVQEGLCFHLFTKHRHDELMTEQQTPEMLRLSLQELVMRVKICKLGDIEQTLAQALDPPSSKNIRRAVDALIEVGALTSSQNLTQLGNQLAKLPLDANLGKLCLMSAIFSCLDVGLTIAALLSSKSPFVTPFGQRQAADNARLAFAKGDSDLLTAYNAYCSWRRVSQDASQNQFAFCRKNFLSQQNLTAIEDLKGHLLASMADTGLVPTSGIDRPSHGRNRLERTSFVQVPAEVDRNSANDFVTTSVIAWSFYPKILTRDGKGWRNISNSQSVTLHPTAVAKAAPGIRDIKYLSYYGLMQMTSGAKNYNALATTPVQDFSLLIGPAGHADWKIHAGVCVIDGNRLRFKVNEWKTAVALKMLRKRLEQVVEARLKEPGRPLDKRLLRWLNIWERISNGEGRDKR